jgi:hypothetical protein
MSKRGSGSTGKGASAGKAGGKSTGTPMTKGAASRIQSAGAKDASSKTSQSGFARTG